LVLRIGDRLAGEAFGQDLRRQIIEPCLEGGQYRQAVLLSQTQGVVGAGFAFARRLPCPSLDLVQGLEELERLQWRAIGFLSRLQRVGELASGMRHTAEMDSAVQRAPGIIAIGHQQAAVVAQKGLRMLLATSGLIVERDNRLLAVPATAVDPHEGLGLCIPAVLLENLNPGLVAVDHGLRPELLLQRLIQPQQMQIDRPDHPVAQCTAADADVCARQRLLQTIQGGAVDIFAGKHERERG
jgi:hypothetical protein